MKQPLVTVITVNYNEPEETISFLDSLYQSDYSNFETIIVDNGSRRKININLEDNYPRLRCIIHDTNIGFAGGNNLGISAGHGEYFLFLNNDTLLPNDFISVMIKFMNEHPKVGIASPKVVYPDGIIQYAGARSINPLTGRGKRIGLLEHDEGQYNIIKKTGLPHGAAMIVSKQALKKNGMMPEEYFLYYEEHDWCTKIKKSGFEMMYIGTTHIIHKESVSVGDDSPLKVYYLNRNRLLYQVRNFKGLKKWSGILFYCFIALPKKASTLLLKGQRKQFYALWRGVFWHINNKYDFKA